MESKYQEALDRLCENDYFDENGNCNCDLIVMDRILLQELVDKAVPKKPFYEADGYDENGELIYDTWICPNCHHYYEVDYDDYDYCPNCGQAIDCELSDVYNPKPYKFEDLKPNMWVYDGIEKLICQIGLISKNAIHREYVDGTISDSPFEEKRFFPVQCANLES